MQLQLHLLALLAGPCQSLSALITIAHKTKWHGNFVFNAERVIHSKSTGASIHGTQAASYTHAFRNRLLFAKRQRECFRLHVGCANTQ